MDTSKAITHLGLCAGYGGIELGLKRVIPSLRSVALCEIESFACANLVSKMEAGLMEPAPIWTDLKTFPWESFCNRVDILTGGYPCQPFSAAGKRLGGGDIRHLWPHISRGISVLRPRVCFFENVEGHITCGLHHVLCDLGRLGYRTTWGIFSASECGAPHQRKRVFILAYRKEQGLEGYGGLEQSGIRNDTWPSRPSKPQYGWEPPRVVGNTDCRRLEGASARGREPAGNVVWTSELGNTESGMSGQSGAGNWWEGAGGAGEAGEAEWQTQPSLGGDLDGSASGMDYAQLCVTCDNRTDELRLLGNGVVPATAALAFRTLAAEFGDRGQP